MQDLPFCEVGGFCGVVCVHHAATRGGQVVGELGEVGDRVLELVLDGTELASLGDNIV